MIVWSFCFHSTPPSERKSKQRSVRNSVWPLPRATTDRVCAGFSRFLLRSYINNLPLTDRFKEEELAESVATFNIRYWESVIMF